MAAGTLHHYSQAGSHMLHGGNVSEDGGHANLRLFTGNAHPGLAAGIANHLGVPVGEMMVTHFNDGEIRVQVEESARGTDVFIIQPTCGPVNDNLMELLIMIDALRRASARRITAVIPYFGYARQDRKVGPRTPISAKLVANLITEAGANRVLTVDLHAGQIQGFFDIPTDNLFAMPVIHKDIQDYIGSEPPMVISPDVGGVLRARSLAKRLGTDLAIVDKRRERAGESEVMNIIGDVEGKPCVLIDDIIDSGGTMCNAADALLKNGATEVYAYAVHGVLSGGAVQRIKNSKIKSLVVTDSIAPTEEMRNCHNIRSISIAPLIGEAMRRINNEESVSSLFD